MAKNISNRKNNVANNRPFKIGAAKTQDVASADNAQFRNHIRTLRTRNRDVPREHCRGGGVPGRVAQPAPPIHPRAYKLHTQTRSPRKKIGTHRL